MPDLPAFTITELTRQLKELVESNFPAVWVVGEASNVTRARSGHVYFTLKDEEAQLSAVMWRSRASRIKFDLHDGLECLAFGAIQIYPPRGGYQLIVDQLLPKGVGSLELAFRQLQEKLAAEGLFDPDRKRPLPRIPRRIALVTSPTGAAVRDVLQVVTRRWPSVQIVVVPVPVQGPGAGERIAAAIRAVPRIPEVDVIVTGRGGGSLEDLWAFNEEVVARAVFDSPIPVVSGVGHEIDVSICDLVADRRALTPSEAGELVVPSAAEIRADLCRLRERLTVALRERAARARLQIDGLARRRVFLKPTERLHELAQRTDELSARLRRAMHRRLDDARRHLATSAASLDALSPLNVVKRGYSLTRRAEDGHVVRTAADVSEGDRLTTLLAHGRVESTVDAVDPTHEWTRPADVTTSPDTNH